MEKEIPFTTALFLVVLVIVISVFGTTTVMTKSTARAPLITALVSGQTNVTVTNDTTITLPNATVAFGTVLQGEVFNTSNHSVQPFVLKNGGNNWLNITINATQLWTVNNTPSFSHYQFNSTFNGTYVAGCPFNGTGTWASAGSLNRTWTNMPVLNGSGDESGCKVGGNCGPVWVAVGMSYANNCNVMKVHIWLDVPATEPGGVHSSTVTFTGYSA